jgi:hypothetical protein
MLAIIRIVRALGNMATTFRIDTDLRPIEEGRARRWRGSVLIAASAFAFSTAGLFTRAIEADAWTILFWRGVFGGLFIGAYIVWHHRAATLRAFRAIGLPGLLAGTCSTVATICFVQALRRTTVADVTIIYATAPFVAAVVTWLWTRERASWATLAASLLALLGVLIMFRTALTAGHLVGLCLCGRRFSRRSSGGGDRGGIPLSRSVRHDPVRPWPASPDLRKPLDVGDTSRIDRESRTALGAAMGVAGIRGAAASCDLDRRRSRHDRRALGHGRRAEEHVAKQVPCGSCRSPRSAVDAEVRGTIGAPSIMRFSLIACRCH